MGVILQSFWRHWHRWVSLLIAIPLIITVSTGLLLMTRGFNTWMQPEYPESSSPEMKVNFDQLLIAAQSVPEARIRAWKDVSQIDIRPGKGQIRIRSKHDNWELSVDSVTGAMLQAGKRRVSFFTALHEGAYFGSIVRYGVFFPSALGTLFLIFSGLFLFFQPYLRMRRSRRQD